jgi:hypothetical protein
MAGDEVAVFGEYTMDSSMQRTELAHWAACGIQHPDPNSIHVMFVIDCTKVEEVGSKLVQLGAAVTTDIFTTSSSSAQGAGQGIDMW